MRRRVLGDNKILKGTIVESNYQVGNLVLYDKTLGKKIVIDLDSPSQEFPLSAYVPLAVIVIPSSHGREIYANDDKPVSAAAMSLLSMSYSTPDSGANTEQTMMWGQYNSYISLPNLNQAPTLGTGSNQAESVTGQTGYPYMPSDKFESSGIVCNHDTNSYYYNGSNTAAPSPYLTDGSRNSMYYQTTTPSSTNNCLADFDGVGNTKVLCDLATAQSDWKTADTITNQRDPGYSPAACCCWRFHPEGTEQGEWYLPAMGELCYMMARFNKIQSSIQAVRDAGAEDFAVLLSTSGSYWSSSEYSSARARRVSTGYGYVDDYGKDNRGRVRAFLRV